MRMKAKTRKRWATVIAGACMCAVAVASFALFTDRAQSQAEYTAGTLDIELTESWTADNAVAAENFTPGDKLDLTYKLENEGNLNAKVRETFVLTTDKPVTDDFEIYKSTDVVEDTTTGLWVKASSSVNPIEVRRSEAYGTGTKITYEVPEHILDKESEEEYKLVILFKADAKNEIKGTNVKLEYIAQAIQEENTGALGDNTVWTDAKVMTGSLNIGGTDRAVVPNLD